MTASLPLVDQLPDEHAAPNRLTWELTHACTLPCVHCLSGSGKPDPQELNTAECLALIDEFVRTQAFPVHICGGEPTVRQDFWDLVDYANERQVRLGFATNGVRITPTVARRLAASGYIDVRISLDGTTERTHDAVRGAGSYRAAVRAMEALASAGVYDFELSVVVTRENAGQCDAFAAIADLFGARLRLTGQPPSGQGADVCGHVQPTADRRIGCLIDPIGDIYVGPLTGGDGFLAGNVRADGGFARIWRESELLAEPRRGQLDEPAHPSRPAA